MARTGSAGGGPGDVAWLLWTRCRRRLGARGRRLWSGGRRHGGVPRAPYPDVPMLCAVLAATGRAPNKAWYVPNLLVSGSPVAVEPATRRSGEAGAAEPELNRCAKNRNCGSWCLSVAQYWSAAQREARKSGSARCRSGVEEHGDGVVDQSLPAFPSWVVADLLGCEPGEQRRPQIESLWCGRSDRR